jgi:hypothetical protein
MASEARAKGTAILQLVKALRSMPDAARAALPPRQRAYLEDRILVTAWYPEADYLALFDALIACVPKSDVDPWEAFGVQAARHDLANVYRGLVRGGDLLSCVRASKELFKLYHDSGAVTVEQYPDHARMEVVGYASVSAGNCRFITSYAREHARLTLGVRITVHETMCTSMGHDRCRREFRAPPT